MSNPATNSAREAAATQKTAEHFGYLWSRSDPARGPVAGYHADLLFERLGIAQPAGRVLDAGCGEGIDLAKQAAKPGCWAAGIEISEGGSRMSAARIEALANAALVRGDLSRLPFKGATFDLIYSYGVLHHLAKPQAGANELARALKPGGTVAIYLYEDFSERSFFWAGMLKAANSLRAWTTRMPSRTLYRLCMGLSPFVFLLFTLPSRVFSRLPLLNRFAETIPFRHARSLPGLTGDLYDRFSAPFEWRYSRAQAQALLERAGLTVLQTVYERGWMVSAVKPQPEGD